MPNKLTGELRLDLTQPATANDLGELLADLDEQGIERGNAIITLQPALPHFGEAGPYGDRPQRPAGMQLVATWNA